MRVLVTNDDGVESEGLHVLTAALVESGLDVIVIAPNSDRSGTGAAIGLVHADQHLDSEKVVLPGCEGIEAYAIDGPPGMCVIAGRLGAFGEPPEVVVSGINPGLEHRPRHSPLGHRRRRAHRAELRRLGPRGEHGSRRTVVLGHRGARSRWTCSRACSKRRTAPSSTSTSPRCRTRK